MPFFWMFQEVHINQIGHVSFASFAVQTNTELQSHSKLPVQLGTACQAELHCCLPPCFPLYFPTACVQELQCHWGKTNGSAVACLTFCPLSEVSVEFQLLFGQASASPPVDRGLCYFTGSSSFYAFRCSGMGTVCSLQWKHIKSFDLC